MILKNRFSWGMILLSWAVNISITHLQAQSSSPCRVDTVVLDLAVESSFNFIFDGSCSSYRDYCIVERHSNMFKSYKSKVYFTLNSDGNRLDRGLIFLQDSCLFKLKPDNLFKLRTYNRNRAIIAYYLQKEDSLIIRNKKFDGDGKEFKWKFLKAKVAVVSVGKHEVPSINFKRKFKSKWFGNYAVTTFPEVFYIVEFLGFY